MQISFHLNDIGNVGIVITGYNLTHATTNKKLNGKAPCLQLYPVSEMNLSCNIVKKNQKHDTLLELF